MFVPVRTSSLNPREAIQGLPQDYCQAGDFCGPSRDADRAIAQRLRSRLESSKALVSRGTAGGILLIGGRDRNRVKAFVMIFFDHRQDHLGSLSRPVVPIAMSAK